MYHHSHTPKKYIPWNKGKLIGQKPPLKIKEIWAIRTRLLLGKKIRDLALFNLAIDSKLRGCDLVKLKDRSHYDSIIKRNIIANWKKLALKVSASIRRHSYI